MKVVRLSAVRTGSVYPPGDIPRKGQRLTRPQDHSAAGRIRQMKNPDHPIVNRTRDLPASNSVSVPV